MWKDSHYHSQPFSFTYVALLALGSIGFQKEGFIMQEVKFLIGFKEQGVWV